MNIYALSSGRGPSGIAIVRISGKETLKICENLTKLKSIKSNEVNEVENKKIQDADDAKEKAAEGVGDLANGTEFLYALDSDTWEVEED